MLQHSVDVYWQRHQRRFPRHNTLTLLCWWVPVSVSGISPVISILEPIHTLCPNEFVGCGCCFFTHREEKKTSMRVKFQTICWAAVGRKFPQSDWCQILSSLIFLSRIVFQLGWWMWAHRLIWRWWWWWSKSVLYRSRQQSCRRLNSSSVLLFVRK